MDLTKIKLPSAIEVEGVFYSIHTGHPFWFRFIELIHGNATVGDLDFLYTSAKPKDRMAGYKALLAFCYDKPDLPRITEDAPSKRITDYKTDADYIYSAFWQCYGIDLCEKELHWHKVRALMRGIVGTKYNEIMQYRCYTGDNKEMQKARSLWELVEMESEQDSEEFEKLFD